jgi:uncharacterized membrane protein YgcG
MLTVQLRHKLTTFFAATTTARTDSSKYSKGSKERKEGDCCRRLPLFFTSPKISFHLHKSFLHICCRRPGGQTNYRRLRHQCQMRIWLLCRRRRRWRRRRRRRRRRCLGHGGGGGGGGGGEGGTNDVFLYTYLRSSTMTLTRNLGQKR